MMENKILGVLRPRTKLTEHKAIVSPFIKIPGA